MKIMKKQKFRTVRAPARTLLNYLSGSVREQLLSTLGASGLKITDPTKEKLENCVPKSQLKSAAQMRTGQCGLMWRTVKSRLSGVVSLNWCRVTG